MSRVISAGMHHATPRGRTVLHVLPASYSLDGVKESVTRAAWSRATSEST